MTKLYVRMTDRFMSGWGAAKGKTNVLVVECETREQVDEIEWVARRRPEMKRVAICAHRPKDRAGVLYTRKTYAGMTGWRYPPDSRSTP